MAYHSQTAGKTLLQGEYSRGHPLLPLKQKIAVNKGTSISVHSAQND